MAKVSLNSIITEKFISRLAAAAEKSSPAPSNPLKGSSSVSLSGSLRMGAQTYATAISGLNNTLSIVNVAKGTLEKLGELTDKMIEITEKAARRPVGAQGRRALDVQLRDLADDFKKIVEKAKVGDKNFLSVDGLTELFIAVGLDKETSSSIAAVFSKFVTPEDDPSLASEKVEGKKPFVVPASAFSTRPADSEYRLEKLTDAALVSNVAGISPSSSVFAATDDILNRNPGTEAVFTRDVVGSLSTQGAGELQGANATLMAVNEVTGYSVIKSTMDPYGSNSNNDPQLFLLDETGALVGQLTQFSTGFEIESVDMASSDERFAVISFDTSSGTSQVQIYDITKGDDPRNAAITDIDASLDTLSGIKIDNNGAFIGYIRTQSGTSNIELYEDGVGFDSFLPSDVQSKDPIDFGFAANDGQIVYSTTLYFGADERDIFTYYDTNYTALQSSVVYDAFATLQNDDTGTGGHYAIVENSGGARTLNVRSSDNGSSTYTFSLGDDTVTGLSLTTNLSDPSRIDAGVVGSLPDIAGDTDLELYRIGFNPDAIGGRRISSETVEYTEILDPSRSITSRPAAYRMLNDLKALREQISDNVTALDDALKVVADNISLVRATGLALLEIGNELTNESDATAVAESLRRRIRQNAGEALAQAENLDPIAVATLTYSSSGN